MGLRNFLWIFLVCAAGLAISVYAYRHQWTLSALPPDPRLESLTYPVTIDDYQAGSLARLRFLAESWPPGTVFQLRDDTGLTIPVVLERRLGMAGLVMTGVSGFVFLVTAIGFFAPRLHQHGYGRFFWVLFPYGMSILLGGVYFPRDGSVLVLGAGFLQLVWLAVLPVAFFRLALVFPRRSDFLDRNGWLLPVLSAVAVGIVAWQSVAFLRFFADPGPPSESAIVPALFAADLFIVSLTGIGFLVFVFRNRGLEMTRERQQFWWLLWGFAIGGAPYVFLRTLPALAGLPPLLPDYVDRIVEMAIPLAFMMAVVKHQFLDIDVIVRRSLLYGLLAGVLVGICLLYTSDAADDSVLV